MEGATNYFIHFYDIDEKADSDLKKALFTHDDLCFKLFTEAGFEWGGDWTNRKDYQHFEIVN